MWQECVEQHKCFHMQHVDMKKDQCCVSCAFLNGGDNGNVFRNCICMNRWMWQSEQAMSGTAVMIAMFEMRVDGTHVFVVSFKSNWIECKSL